MEQVVKFKTHRSDYDIRESMQYAMSVSDLIDMLERLPKNAKVVFDNDNGYTFGEISPNTIKLVEVETYEEEREREEREAREADLEEIAQIISFLKKSVNKNNGELILDMSGIILDTCCEDKEDSLMVTELTTKIGGSLYGNTNWGLINLEETITDIWDWYTLKDKVWFLE